jgi:arsenate reductase
VLHVHGIPTCGTVRKALAWLASRGVPHRFVDLRASPPPRATVAAWVAAAGSGPLRNTSGGSYRALGPEKDAWDDAAWTDAFTADPMLLRRPVITGDAPADVRLVGFRGDDDTIARALGL